MNVFSDELKKAVLGYFQLDNASAQKQEKFLASINQLGNEIALNTILDGLNDEEAVAFLRFSEEGEDEKALEYAHIKIPDLNEKISQEIAKTLTELKQ